MHGKKHGQKLLWTLIKILCNCNCAMIQIAKAGNYVGFCMQLIH